MANPIVIDVATLDQLNGAIAYVDAQTSGSFEIKLTANIDEGTSATAGQSGTTGDLTYPASQGGGTAMSEGVAVPARQDLYALNLASGVQVTIDGANTTGGVNYAIDGRNNTTANGTITAGTTNTYRGLFVYSGQVTISDLTIQNTRAEGGAGSGGGAGLGGGLFVAGPNASSAGGVVTLSDVAFTNDHAQGGAASGTGAGGGLGGNASGGGGGGVGNGESGIILGGARAGGGSGGPGGPFGGRGGPATPGYGGNGGVGGAFGGGGGLGNGENAGYGGGGGGINLQTSDVGGFGGGKGSSTSGAGGGFGGGGGAGGGGLGAGGAIFIQAGGSLTIQNDLSISGDQVTAGVGYNHGTNGSDFGSGLFVQGQDGTPTTIDVGSGTISSVITDYTGSGGTNPNGGKNSADQGGSLALAKTSIGTLTLSATNTYTGGTALDAGTLDLEAQGAAGTTQTGSEAAGGVAFNGPDTTLQIGYSALNANNSYTAPVTAFGGASGQEVDLSSYLGANKATLSGSTLTVSGGRATFTEGSTETLTDFSLAPGFDPTRFVFETTSDGGSGTEVIGGANASYITQSLTVEQRSAATPLFTQAPTVTDGSDSTVTATLTLNPTAGTLGGAGQASSNGTYTITGTAAQVTTELDKVTFTPAGGFYGNATVGLSLSDAFGQGETGSVAVTVNPSTPTISGTHATADAGEAPVTPFAASATSPAATVTDSNTGATDTLTIALSGGGGTLADGTGYMNGNGTLKQTVAGQDGTYTLTASASAITSELDALVFTPVSGTPGAMVSTTFALTDASSAGPSSATDTGTVVTDAAATPTNPTISGLSPVTTALQDAMQPFGSATVSDPTPAALDSVTITPSGAAGVLAGSGLTANPDGTYTLGFASPQTVTQELDALTFTPAITNDGPVEATTFQLTDTSTSGASSSASTSYTVNSTPNQGDFGTTTTSATSPQGEVYALYEGLLARAPDPVGGETAVADLQNGASLDQLTQSLLVSSEGSSYFTPNSSNGDFVNQLYERVLGRVDSYSEQAYWDQTLANGTSRAQVADDFVFSQEHLNDIQPALSQGVFVADAATSETARLYYGLLDRSPDAGGLAANTGQLDATMSLTGLAQSFLNSSEYAADNPVPPSNQAFVNALFENALGRSPDPGGYWVQQLDSGAETRAQVTVGIVESAEAKQHLAGRIETGFHIA